MFHPRPLHGVASPLPVRPSPERSPPKLCENGRAYITDPSTGQHVCLCQLDAHPAHSMQAHPALRGVTRSLPSPRPRFADVHNYHAQLTAMTPLGEQTNGLLPPHIAFHPYGAMYGGLDMNGGPLRKAATRETTGPLKAWLNEHKKNPYPTKAEKIMLAIITRMTLTQVSTWFANARRRLKKDNRLSSGDVEEDSVDIDSDRELDSDSVSVDVSVNGDRDVQTVLRTDVKLSSEGEIEPDSFSDISDDENNHVFRSQYREHKSRRNPDVHAQDTASSAITTSSVGANNFATSVIQSDSSPTKIVSEADSSKSPSRLHTSTDKPGIDPAIEKPKPKPKIWSISHILDS